MEKKVALGIVVLAIGILTVIIPHLEMAVTGGMNPILSELSLILIVPLSFLYLIVLEKSAQEKRMLNVALIGMFLIIMPSIITRTHIISGLNELRIMTAIAIVLICLIYYKREKMPADIVFPLSIAGLLVLVISSGFTANTFLFYTGTTCGFGKYSVPCTSSELIMNFFLTTFAWIALMLVSLYIESKHSPRKPKLKKGAK